MSPNFLVDGSRATHICYISIGKLMIRHEDLLSSIVKLEKDVPTATIFGITHLEGAVHYILFQKNIVLII